MFAFIRSLFTKSINSIIADITKKIEHLHIVAELHAAESVVQTAIAKEATAARLFADTEYSRAKSIAGKLTALISG